MASDKSISTDVKAIEGGKIVFAPDVVATIANLAASEVEGVASLSGSVVEGITGMLGGKKSLTKGIKVDIAEETATIDISVVVKYGYKIHEVCQNIQKKVKTTIETMTGLSVAAINVSVQSISFDKGESKPSEPVSGEEKTEA
ncbi:MAG: Asp23/Gls24 family envelope stress response protein [Clostridia bacterium]|nr:Asp23/Gls24 family envelope stress response protein [Candidatus Pelethousia sp.]NCB30435.1 Asp23/Gls24 family envelope stress response protein [Clostridia bacterium]